MRQSIHENDNNDNNNLILYNFNESKLVYSVSVPDRDSGGAECSVLNETQRISNLHDLAHRLFSAGTDGSGLHCPKGGVRATTNQLDEGVRQHKSLPLDLQSGIVQEQWLNRCSGLIT